MRYFNIKEVKGFTLGKEYFILDQKNTFINDLNQVVSEIRNIKLNKLNI
jgi:hypothetical protein